VLRVVAGGIVEVERCDRRAQRDSPQTSEPGRGTYVESTVFFAVERDVAGVVTEATDEDPKTPSAVGRRFTSVVEATLRDVGTVNVRRNANYASPKSHTAPRQDPSLRLSALEGSPACFQCGLELFDHRALRHDSTPRWLF